VCQTVAKLSAATAENGVVDEERMSNEQLDSSYGPLRELVTESIHQQEDVLGRVQVRVFNSFFDRCYTRVLQSALYLVSFAGGLSCRTDSTGLFYTGDF